MRKITHSHSLLVHVYAQDPSQLAMCSMRHRCRTKRVRVLQARNLGESERCDELLEGPQVIDSAGRRRHRSLVIASIFPHDTDLLEFVKGRVTLIRGAIHNGYYRFPRSYTMAGIIMLAMVQVFPPSEVTMSLATTPEPMPRVEGKFGSASRRMMVVSL